MPDDKKPGLAVIIAGKGKPEGKGDDDTSMFPEMAKDMIGAVKDGDAKLLAGILKALKG